MKAFASAVPAVSCPARLFLIGLLSLGSWAVAARSEFRLETVTIAPDGSGFRLVPSGRIFRPWGVNYDHDSTGEGGRLLEDYWVEEWAAVESDFAEIAALGANAVRIHLQFGRFMTAPDRPDEAALDRLRSLLDLADRTGLYLDITGLGCYHRHDVPAWYDAMDEARRWEAQARFWTAVTRACLDHPAVFCFDLMNEPVVPGEANDGWLAGELGGKHFVQRLTLEPGDRTPRAIAKAWVDQLAGAIRREDPDRLITVGVIPWALVWPKAKPLFYSPEIAPALDFVSVHFYPKAGEVDRAIEALSVYDLGKPLVIEETFPLHCPREEMIEFLTRSRAVAEGWISFYWGKTAAELESDPGGGITAAVVAGWLRTFEELAPEMRAP